MQFDPTQPSAALFIQCGGQLYDGCCTRGMALVPQYDHNKYKMPFLEKLCVNTEMLKLNNIEMWTDIE